MPIPGTTIRVSEDLDGPAIRMEGDNSGIFGINMVGNGSGVAVQTRGRNIDIGNVRLSNFSVGVEARQGTSATITGSRFTDNRIADIAYEDDVILTIVDTYAKRLFNLTEGGISSIDRELNRISYELITTTDPSRIAALLVWLANFLQDNEKQIRWSLKWTIGVKLLEKVLDHV